jgi:hypothetical protein
MIAGKPPLHLYRKGGDKIVRNRSQKSQQNSCIQFQTGGSLAGSRGSNSVCPGRKTDRDTEFYLSLGPGVKWV